MEVLFDHPNPFRYAHGGFQIQIEQTKKALEQAGVTVDWLRWWDTEQRGQIIHYFGRPNDWYVEAAQKAGFKVIVAELLTGLGSRGRFGRRVQRQIIPRLRKSFFFARMGWNTFRTADACVALTRWEAMLMEEIFDASPARTHVVGNGVETEFLHSSPETRGQWLVCTVTITERKRALETAQAAVLAKTPLWIIGRPYDSSDPYGQRFIEFARKNSEFIRYEGPLHDRAALAKAYRQSRGFVLLSTMESQSLSALEAAACECPLLLSDLPWARMTFDANATYAPICAPEQTAAHLRSFYDRAPTLAIPPRPPSWPEIAEQLKAVYAPLLQ